MYIGGYCTVSYKTRSTSSSLVVADQRQPQPRARANHSRIHSMTNRYGMMCILFALICYPHSFPWH